MLKVKMLKNENGVVNFPTRDVVDALVRISATDYALANGCDNVSYAKAYDGKTGACAWLGEHFENNDKLIGVLVNDVRGTYTVSYGDKEGYGSLPTAKFDVKSVLANGDYQKGGIKLKGAELDTVVIPQLQYPQTKANATVSKELNVMLNEGKLAKTGKTYGLNKDAEYELNGKFYVRTTAKNAGLVAGYADGKEFKNNETIWVEVEPIKWVVLGRNGSELTLMTAQVLTAGKYNELNNYNNNEFLNEIDHNNLLEIADQKANTLEEEKRNAYMQEAVLEQEDAELEDALKTRVKEDKLAREFNLDCANEARVRKADLDIEREI